MWRPSSAAISAANAHIVSSLGVLGDVDVEILRAALGGDGEDQRVARGLRRAHHFGLRAEEVAGVLPGRDLRQLAAGGADGEQLVLLALLAADALELVGDVIHAGIAHVALELGEPFGGFALQDQRVRVELLEVSR